MLLWVILFLLIVAISFVLAFLSMRDYQAIPQQISKDEYGLFLVRQTGNFNSKILDSILKLTVAKDLILSIERLFKGNETVLTLFGPKEHLLKFHGDLNLLELEDYAASLDHEAASVWEVGTKEPKKFKREGISNIFSALPKLEAEDQFFWQTVLGKNQTQIRAAFHSKDPVKKKALTPVFQDLKMGDLMKIPSPFSNEQMMEFYRLRSLSKESKSPVLGVEEIINLIKI